MSVESRPGVDSQAVMEMDSAYVMHTVRRQPLVLVRGEGARVWDAEGKEYLDFLAGIAVNGLGHAHPRLVESIRNQAGKLMHVSNLYYIPEQPLLAKKLVELSGLGKAFFCNSGAEANETAIKLARKWSYKTHGEDKYEIITALKSFHGRTMGAITATGQPKYHKGFSPMLPGFKYVPYNDISALEEAVGPNTAAIMLEPVQGESGVHPASLEYMKRVRNLCDEKGILLILDEVQTGLGRTGKWFGFDHYGIKPDIMSLAKTLGGGFPIGACVATSSVADAFEPGDHASTFGGNPLACAAALTTLQVMEDEDLIGNAARVGSYFKSALNGIKAKTGAVADVRGLGLMLGMELSGGNAQQVAAECLKRGLIINPIGLDVIRFLPPLMIGEADVDSAVKILQDVIAGSAS
jgi:predicted acetylornithine/succinylornithine family transaminase